MGKVESKANVMTCAGYSEERQGLNLDNDRDLVEYLILLDEILGIVDQ